MGKSYITLRNGLEIATRHPSQCAVLLAKYIYPVLEREDWFHKELRLKFCAYFIQNLVDQSIEEEIDKELYEKVKGMALDRSMRLMRRNPKSGLKILVAVISRSLREEQRFSQQEQYDFYNELFGRFFPDSRIREEHDS